MEAAHIQIDEIDETNPLELVNPSASFQVTEGLILRFSRYAIGLPENSKIVFKGKVLNPKTMLWHVTSGSTTGLHLLKDFSDREKREQDALNIKVPKLKKSLGKRLRSVLSLIS